MAITAINLEDLKTVSHPEDKDGAPTRFTIGAVDSRVLGQLKDRSLVVGVDTDNPEADADVKLAQNELAFETVQFGLKGVSNLLGKEGEIAYKTERKTVGSKAYDVAHSDVVRRIPNGVLSWLHREIMALNELGFAEGN